MSSVDDSVPLQHLLFLCSESLRHHYSPIQGVNFAGPLYVGREKGEEGNKVWICLFTCCVTRTIHLELVSDMSTVTFVRALKRFSARRGLPRKILSDNAKTFKAAAKLLKTIFECQEVKDYLSNVGVEWVFNPEPEPPKRPTTRLCIKAT